MRLRYWVEVGEGGGEGEGEEEMRILDAPFSPNPSFPGEGGGSERNAPTPALSHEVGEGEKGEEKKI